MIKISARIGDFEVSATVAPVPPLGWRFWTLAGFPGDPVEPRAYGGTRCLPMTLVDIEGHALWLCAMEQDHSFQLFCSHDLFPSGDQDGVEAFAQAIIETSVKRPEPR